MPHIFQGLTCQYDLPLLISARYTQYYNDGQLFLTAAMLRLKHIKVIIVDISAQVDVQLLYISGILFGSEFRLVQK